MIVLNVGGGTNRELPPEYAGWEQRILDIDPACNPDVVLDAKCMTTLPPAEYDAVYCSHNLEHFYIHEVPKVLNGFVHVLKDDGFANIAVPSPVRTMEHMKRLNLDIMDTYYRTGDGYPISFHDVLYGCGSVMTNGNLYFAHKCGFTPRSLADEMYKAGFKLVVIGEDGMNIFAKGYKSCQSQ